jgi:asparagine synthase (glutamine-hydrolysing)
VCGIAGIVGRASEVVEASDVHRMCQAIVHRGPDDEGIYARGVAGLGMRRLSIIDVAGGHQPIHNEGQTVWAVFNGEIYNYLELRAGLEGRGHHFYTHSDTEVIIHLYEEMGGECFSKLRGMFAIAIWDERRQSLLLGRDRLGKKPVHYALHQGRLLFGSEIKAIHAVAPELATPSPEALLQYFYFGYIPDPLTAFSEIQKLPPGHLLEYSGGKLNVRRYWDVPAYGNKPPKSEEECLDVLESKLAEAVRIRLMSEVPLGALLSGGVDSSIIVALMARASSSAVKTFSIGFAEDQFNESEYARIIAETFGTEHHEMVVDPNIEETIAYLSSMMEEPFGDSSMLPTYFVCRMARREVTVALSGDGGDEMFGGYDRYAVARQRGQSSGMPPWAGKLYRQQVHSRLPAGFYGKNLAWNASLNWRDRYLDSITFLPARDRERSVFSRDFLEVADRLPDPLRDFRNYFDHAPGAPDDLSRLLYLDTKTYLAGDILTKVDRMSMATSLEVRVPMLDQEFVEWTASLPIEWKFRGSKFQGSASKYLLKGLAKRLGIPAEVLHRPKQGFQLPLEPWLRGQLKHRFLAILTEPRTLQRGYFRPEAVRGLVDEHVRGRRNRSGVLWKMLILEWWHRNYVEGGAAQRTPPRLEFKETGTAPAPHVAPAAASPADWRPANA